MIFAILLTPDGLSNESIQIFFDSDVIESLNYFVGFDVKFRQFYGQFAAQHALSQVILQSLL